MFSWLCGVFLLGLFFRCALDLLFCYLFGLYVGEYWLPFTDCVFQIVGGSIVLFLVYVFCVLLVVLFDLYIFMNVSCVFTAWVLAWFCFGLVCLVVLFVFLFGFSGGF